MKIKILQVVNYECQNGLAQVRSVRSDQVEEISLVKCITVHSLYAIQNRFKVLYF